MPMVATSSAMRDMSDNEAKALRPASEHYTAYVGPPDQYDFMDPALVTLLNMKVPRHLPRP